MIRLAPRVFVEDSEIEFSCVTGSGPGGQNVNKTATAVQLRFNVYSLPEEIRLRLINLAGKRVNNAGILVIDARVHRSQPRNREDALARLRNLVLRASHKPRIRKATKPTKTSVEERLKIKNKRSEIKKSRRTDIDDRD